MGNIRTDDVMKTFGAASTADEVLDGVDLHGKRVLVTGVSAGLGVETARSLAARGAYVVGAARDLDKARTATIGIPGIELVALDLANLTSVRTCADLLVRTDAVFDVVIANAGVMACPQSATENGFEMQLGVNHLGHFVLVNRITSLLKPGSRLVCLSSAGHRFADVELADPNFEHTPYNEWTAYGRSKTANILFVVEFDRRWRNAGIRASAVHPGAVETELSRHMTASAREAMIASINAERPQGTPEFHYKTTPQGAATSVWAGFVEDADVIGGRYCEDCHVAGMSEGDSLREGVRAYALDPERAKALWTLSEAMVDERF